MTPLVRCPFALALLSLSFVAVPVRAAADAPVSDELPMKATEPAARTAEPTPAPTDPAGRAVAPAPGAAAPGAAEPAHASGIPDGRALLRAFADASGGGASLAGVQNAMVIGTYGVPAQSLSGSLTITVARPNLIHSTGELPGVGTIEKGFDGKVGWVVNPMSGARLLGENEVNQLQRSETNIFHLASLDAMYEKAETVGRTTFAGKDAWEVRLVADGRESTAYFDPTTRLMTGMKTSVASEYGEIPAIVTLSDYRAFGGLTLPTRSTQSIMGGILEATSTINDVRFNVPASELPSFAPPAEVQALQAPTAAGD